MVELILILTIFAVALMWKPAAVISIIFWVFILGVVGYYGLMLAIMLSL